MDRPTIAQTTAGALRGTTEGGVHVWRGVGYAAQPVGALRFRAPQPLTPWSGIRDAIDHGPIPPQGKSFVGGGRDDPKMRDEACLTVTVWSPDATGSLPVMVWIPGGAFVFGAGQLQLYNGSRLAANGNVVVVNVTYRLGVFGGFELSDLGPGFDDNLCLRDQIAALQWVRDNIAAFGGDPEQVTVFGESAGATSVLALLASPVADGLFGRAIAQSPALTLIADRETRARQAHEFVRRLGVGVDEIAALPQRQLRRAAGQLQGESAANSPKLAYGLTYGVDLLPEHPVTAARAGAVTKLPLIVGTNSREASMFAWGKPPMLPTTVPMIDDYFERTAPDAKDAVLQSYPSYPRRRALIEVGSDVMFGVPTWAFADAYSQHAPTHVYRFDHTTWTLKVLGLGATHGSEIVHIQHSYGSYLGRMLHPLGRQVQPSVGRRMQRLWLDFASRERLDFASLERLDFATQSDGMTDWPAYDTERRATRVIGSTRDETIDDPDRVRRAAWDGLYAP
ncbi:carboxylesterase/lipase family protein [Mycobacterium sp. CBMA293]|nr:carboxylesterase/lipase family protein [Mycolicibacterium sp. CBMA 360]MUL58166.1 carboxylesterase/lipase family protein [Mycolicibacterium sp. CBMA 335]MUL73624.1 carboxylesterase/lipase family protein [Mycolicibacterium sp. CBMA 311]MUL93049.1 carboxylesterase/lipase family protein [Mycolicibacterium sp. CBMA 230]MUM09892.1 carboxylesterase/lipase family protein [Mycolicibacterium sp. CBMA 293]